MRRTVLARGETVDTPAQRLAGQLHAVADSQHRQTQLEQPRITLRRAALVDARRTSRQDQPDRRMFPHLFDRDVVPHDLAEHVLLAHAARDQLGVLRAEVEHQHSLARGLRRLPSGRLRMAAHHQDPRRFGRRKSRHPGTKNTKIPRDQLGGKRKDEL